MDKLIHIACYESARKNSKRKLLKVVVKKPVWGDTFDFDISNEKELSIQVMDKEAMGKDKPIGKTTVSIMQWIAKGYI